MALPPHMRADDPAAADPARRRLLRRSPFPRLPSLPSRPSKPASLPRLSTDHPADEIRIDDATLSPSPQNKDLYRWAILYENQRGVTLSSTPFYSPLSLLPFDPHPFTLPHSYSTRASNPNLSLDNYPLPDGTWRWISTTWMIDMRTDLGEVQHDGFEYNWSFRDSHWHAQIGKLSAGAWVRRRRWVRLMTRPASRIHGHDTPFDTNHTSIPLFHSPSSPALVLPASNLSLPESDHRASHVWDGGEQDWRHVHRLLKQLGRDGRKLELWRMWLGPCAKTHPSDNNTRGVIPEGNPPPTVHLITIFKNHGDAILHSFVFPDSRAQFVDLVRRAGLAQDLESCLGHAFSAADVDFWSYADNLDKLLDRDS